MILYYVRHGDPIYNPDSLTELGHKQAEALSKRFALYGLDEIYCSTSNRAIQTAEPTCKMLNKEKTLLDWANEGHAFADFCATKADGSRVWSFYIPERIRQFNDKEVKALVDKWYEHPYFEDTNFKRGVERINRETDAFMLNLGYEHDRENGKYKCIRKNEKRVALFAHEGFGKAFLSSLLDIPFPTICTKFQLSHSSVTVIHFGEGDSVYPHLLQWSNDSHLYKENALTGYNNSLNI